MRRFVAGAAMVALTGLAAGCGISQQQEVQIGAQQAQQVNQQLPIINDPAINRYLNVLGDSLAHVTSRADLDWHFYMVNTNDFNAFALPGGYIFVTRGILALANDQSELAAILAHEISHVILHHSQARTERAKTTDLVDKVVSGVFGSDPSTDQSANKAKLSFAAFSQAQELAADKSGIQIAGRAGFDPYAAARFLSAMGRFAQYQQGTADQGDDFLSSHPSTPDRVQKANDIARMTFGPPGTGDQDRQDYMAAIDGMVFGDSPSHGAIAGQRFIQPTLKFTFTVPVGYKLQITPMMPNMGYHFMNPKITTFDVTKPPILVYGKRGSSWQLVAFEWVFPKKPAKPPLPGATYGSFGAACHYKDGTFVFQADQNACASKSPQSGSAFGFWHPDLVTLHVWAWYPNPAGVYSGMNPLMHPFNKG